MIPQEYVWLTEGHKNRAKRFREYVEAYVDTYGLKLVKIEGMKAICEPKNKDNQGR